MAYIFEKFIEGPLQVNTFLLADPDHEDKPAAIIDPAGEARGLIDFVKESNLQPVYIINTHGHVDHISYNKKFKELYGAEILIHEADAPMLGNEQDPYLFQLVGASLSPPADRAFKDGERIEIGSITLEIIHTPGHTPGSVCLRHDDFMITGDTLFAGGIGRHDLPGGSYDDLIRSIKERLLTLPEELEIFPGHMESSTIGDEIENNPFLQI